MSSYPPSGPYPPRTGPQPPGDWRQQRRSRRDQARAQRALYQGQRRGSIVGPLLVIAIGVVFLLIQTGHLDAHRLWDWYGRWWPILLVGLGIILLIEWTVDQWLSRRSVTGSDAGPGYVAAPPRRSIGGGVVLLLLLLIGMGVVFSAVGRHGRRDFFARNFNLNQDNLEQFLGDKHESDQTFTHLLPADASVSIDNPRGDVVVSGTSDDGQLHITAHKEVFSRSDGDADGEARQLNPRIDVTGPDVVVSVSPVHGGRADLNILLPPSVRLAVTANHGDIRVNLMKSAVSLTANHGDTEISGITGSVSAHSNSSSGSFAAHSITGPLSIEGRGHDLTLSDIAGTVDINGDFFGMTHLERLRGAVKFHTSRTDLKLASLLGELEISPDASLSVTEAVGPVALNTRNRNITLDRVSGDLDVTNRNGSVDLTAAPPLGNVNVQNRNGSVNLTLPAKASFVLSAETIDGDLSNDFSLPLQETDSRKTLTGTVGKGGSVIRINTTQGDVSVRKASVAPMPPRPPEPPVRPAVSLNGEDGSSVVIGKDGVRVISGADGSSVVIGKDGLRITANADGSSVYKSKDGRELTENADGSKIYFQKDGTRIMIGADGHQTAMGPGGLSLSEDAAQEKIRHAQEEIRRTEQQRDRERRQHQPGKASEPTP